MNVYDAHGDNRKVHRITKRQLNRVANAVADLLRQSACGQPAFGR